MKTEEIIARLKYLEDESLRLQLKIREFVVLLKEDLDSDEPRV